MREELLLYPCGSIVKTRLGSHEGMITCQAIRFDSVKYEVVYFLNGEQQIIWMHCDEFETTAEKKKIGF